MAAQVTVVGRQQRLDGLLTHLLGKKAGLGRLASLLQKASRPHIILGLTQPEAGPVAGAFLAHGKRLPVSSEIDSARSVRQNGASA